MTDALLLVTNEDAPFFREQVRALQAAGVDCDVLAVPDAAEGGRSVAHYGRFYAKVIAHSPGAYDVIHANYGLTAPAALAQPHRPVVCSLWGSDLFGRYGRVSRWCANRCDEVIVMSQEMAAALDRECHVIPHGIDLSTFSPRPRDQARAAVGWDPDTNYVLFPYDPEREVKDYPRARRVVDRVADRVTGPVELAAVHGLAHERVPEYLNAADALLLTSTREGSPNVVKEALACDLPVVATDVGDVAERVAELEYSAVCADDDALIARLAAVLEAAPVTEGRDTVADLGLERMAERIVSVYETAAGREVPVSA
ncbi:MAG: glycosyltransferase [Haloarculaceae archaeon]